SEVRGEGRDWIRSPIEEQVFAQAPLLGRERRVALQLLRVHDRHVQTRLNTVIEEDRVEDLATGGRQPERHVGNAQDRLALGEALLAQSNSLDRPDGATHILLIA